MNILIEAGDLNPPFVEGTRNIVMTHARELIKRGHKVVFLTKRKETNTGRIFQKEEFIQGIHYYRWSNPIKLFLTFRKIIEHEEIDIVHIFSKGLRPPTYFKIIKLGGKPIIFTLLGYPFGKKYNEKHLNELLKYVERLTVTSKTLFEILKKYNPKKIIYLPYGIEVEKYSKNYSNKKKGARIISLRFWLREVLSAFEKIRKEEPNIRLIISTSQKGKDEEKFIEDKGLKESITEIGLLKNMHGLLSGSPVVLELDSIGKKLLCASPPLLMIESMASGARIVSTDIPELKEIIGENEAGILIRENSPEEIYLGIKKALKNKNIGKNAMKKINKEYNIQRNIKIYEKIYSLKGRI
jgi:glycosyltransferase involved in cell wall biosynthesis